MKDAPFSLVFSIEKFKLFPNKGQIFLQLKAECFSFWFFANVLPCRN